MSAVTALDSRIDGRTTEDSVTAFTFGNANVTANGRWKPDWLPARSGVRDSPHVHPPATGHGHRP